MLRTTRVPRSFNLGPPCRCLYERRYHESAQMSALHSNAQANIILDEAGVLVVGVEVERDQVIEWSNLELCTRRIRIEVDLAQMGLLHDNELMSDLSAFSVILNQHVYSQYDTTNLPRWALRLKDEIIAILDGKLEGAKEELSKRFDKIEVQIGEMKTAFENIEEEMGEMKTAIQDIKVQMGEMKTSIEDVRMHMWFIALCMFFGNIVVLGMFEAISRR